MNTSTQTPRGATGRDNASSKHSTRKAQTYLPEAENRKEFLDFAEFMRTLEVFLTQNESKAALVDPEGNERQIPNEIFRILDQVTNALASGEGITVVPQGMTMTTQQAADYLGISRPTLVRLLEGGEIEYQQPGRHRRVRLDDLVAYQDAFRSERREALRDLRRSNVKAKVKVGNPADIQRRTELDVD